MLQYAELLHDWGLISFIWIQGEEWWWRSKSSRLSTLYMLVFTSYTLFFKILNCKKVNFWVKDNPWEPVGGVVLLFGCPCCTHRQNLLSTAGRTRRDHRTPDSPPPHWLKIEMNVRIIYTVLTFAMSLTLTFKWLFKVPFTRTACVNLCHLLFNTGVNGNKNPNVEIGLGGILYICIFTSSQTHCSSLTLLQNEITGLETLSWLLSNSTSNGIWLH